MTRVSGLDSSGDWTFGKGRANYLTRSDAIRQSVVTRLKSLKDDWFLDIEHGSPWYEILGTRGNEARILQQVESIVLNTDGVRTIERLRVLAADDRAATVELVYRDIYDTQTAETVSLL